MAALIRAGCKQHLHAVKVFIAWYKQQYVGLVIDSLVEPFEVLLVFLNGAFPPFHRVAAHDPYLVCNLRNQPAPKIRS